MANLLKKKFIGANEVDGSKILLENNEALRFKNADGTVRSVLKLDGANKVVLSDAPIITVTSTDAGAVQTKSQVDSAVSAEATLRQNADAALQTELDGTQADLATEITNRTNADTALGGRIDTEISDRQAADALLIPLTQKGAANGVAPLDGSSLIPSQYLPSFVDDVLEYSPKKASALIQDLTHTADAGGVAGNSISLTYVAPAVASAALSISVSGSDITVNLATNASSVVISTAADIKAALDAHAGASALIDVAVSGVGTNVQAAQAKTLLSGGTDGKGAFPATGEAGKIYVALDSLKTYRWGGSAYAEISPSEVNSVNGKVGVVTLNSGEVPEGSNLYFTDARAQAANDARFDLVEAKNVEQDGRLDALEADIPNWHKMKIALVAADITNGYVDLAHSAVAGSLSAMVDRLNIHEGAAEDYTLSLVGGVTRVTFVNSLVAPGQEALVAGDNLYFKYQY